MEQIFANLRQPAERARAVAHEGAAHIHAFEKRLPEVGDGAFPWPRGGGGRSGWCRRGRGGGAAWCGEGSGSLGNGKRRLGLDWPLPKSAGGDGLPTEASNLSVQP